MKKYFIAIAVAAVSLASCSEKVEPVNGTDEAKYVPVEIASVEIPATKAVVSGTEFSEGSSIGTFLCAQNSTTAYSSGSTNVKYSKGSDNNWTSTTPLMVSATKGDLYAYYPYKDGVSDITSISITNAEDWMYAENQTIDNTSGAVSLTMKHALAYVEVTIKKTTDYVGTANLSKITFSGLTPQTRPYIAASGNFNAKAGTVSGIAADVSFDVGSDSGAEITTSGYKHDCLFIPTKSNTNRQEVKLTFTIGGKDKSIDLTGTSSTGNGIKFAPGVKSTVTITLSPKGLTLDSVAITEWTNGTSSSGTIDS